MEALFEKDKINEKASNVYLGQYGSDQLLRIYIFRYMIPTDKTQTNTLDPTATTKPIDKVYIAGSMTSWKCVEMIRTKGDAYFCVIIDCYEGDVFYKFCVDGRWTIDYSMVSCRN